MNKEEMFDFYQKKNKITIKEINNHTDNSWFLGNDICNCSFCNFIRENKNLKDK